ncbi:MAG: cation diffusion facilitator family transporter [Proteobacteria bacterium]|nr:cation diffusion facilitator family transporter [Pseudomonadota bacterium]
MGQRDNRKGLIISLAITLALFGVEVIGGIISNSLALLSDAGHVVTDALALGLSLVAAQISGKAPDGRATFGYRKVGILAALINGVSLLVIPAFIFVESYQRLLSPPTIHVRSMLTIAVVGLLGNLIMTWILGRKHEDLNVKSAWLHVLGDTLSSVGVIISGIVVTLTDWPYADPIAGAVIGIIIVFGGVRLVKDTLAIFLDLTPKELSVKKLSQWIAGIPGVQGIHDVHLWPVGYKAYAFSAHILVDDQKVSEAEQVKEAVTEMLHETGIYHVTLQLEAYECDNNGMFCGVKEIGGDDGLSDHHQ